MTATTQHGPHPPGAHLEAELLSAFTDRALPAHERNHVLAHLAVCARCRQVVALAASAGELESHTLVAAAAAAPSHGTTAARRHTTWWRNWHFAWIPVAALVATVSLAAYIHIVHIDRAAQLARINPPAVSQIEALSPSPALSQNETAPASSAQSAPPTESKQQNPSPPPSAKSQPHLPSFTDAPAPPEPKAAYAGAAAAPRVLPSEQAPAAPPPASVTETVTVASDQSAPETASAQQSISLQPSLKAANSPLRATPPPPAASPAAPQLQAEREKKFTDFNRQVETTETSDHLSAARANPQSAPVAAAVSGSNTSAASYTQPAASNRSSIGSFSSAFGLASTAGHAGTPIHLPSGLALASIASSGPLLLAIDNSGALFLTQDSGITWRQVAHQWTGRAVLVRTRNLADRRAETAPAPTSGAESATASPAPAAPSIVFEITNEKNQVWQSADGLVWTPK